MTSSNDTAHALIDALIKDFADDPQLTGVIYQLADEYWNSQRYEGSGRLYQSVLDRDPNGELAVWAKGWITGLELMLGNSVSAQQVIDVLVRDCAGQSQLVLGRILYDNANGCWFVGKYKEARELYKYIADNLPESDQFMRAKALVAVAGCDMKMGNYAAAEEGYAAAEEGINALIEDFAGHPNLAKQVLQVAEPYYDEAFRKEAEGLNSQARDYFQKALRIYERVKNEVPGYVATADTYCWTGACYRALGEYEKSIVCYQKVVDDYPGYYKYAWNAQFLVGRNYEDLKESGIISKLEADTKIKAAYEQLLEKYPNCKAARIARRWLSSHNSK